MIKFFTPPPLPGTVAVEGGGERNHYDGSVIKELLPEEKNAKTDLLINRVLGRRQGRENQLAVYVPFKCRPII
jgi:predicted patatin/cPLA2 family phospholipase